MERQNIGPANTVLKKIFTSHISLAVFLFGLFVWPLIVGNLYYRHVAIIMLLGAISALGFNIFFGYTGQVNFGPIAFYGIGAYSCALMEMRLGIPWFIGALFIAPLAAGMVSLLLSIPILRLRGHGMALGTFAFAYMMYLILERWTRFTGGGDGMLVKAPEIFGHNLRQSPGLYYVILLCAILCFIICHWLISSKHGRAMKAIRTDEVSAAAMGINVMRYKRAVYVLSSAMIGLAGGLLSQQAGWLGPDYASISGNILIILMLITGGRRSNAGQVVGGFFIGILPVLLADFVEYAVVIYSIILMIMLRFMPDGIIGIIRRWLGLPVVK
jgi:branched-chain amino acid transport system permease protein